MCMKVYFDTNIIDAIFTLLKWDKDEPDPDFSDSKNLDMEKNLISLRYLLEVGEEQWDMVFGTSTLTQEEISHIKIDKNPLYYSEKIPDLNLVVRALATVPLSDFEKDKRTNRLSPAEESTLSQKISSLVSDAGDVKHLIEFRNARWDVFLTLDWRDLLSNRVPLSFLGLDVCSPLDLLERFLPLDMVIRALHGSWETKPITSKPVPNQKREDQIR